MKRSVLSVILIVAMLLPLCACQDSSVDTPTQPSEQESTAATFETQPSDPTEISDPTDATEPSDETDPIEATENTDSIEDTKNTDPTESTDPSESSDPSESTDPTESTRSTDPTENTRPSTATMPTAPAQTHQHDWVFVNCLNPKVCTTCGASEGIPKNHNWIKATCTNPSTCRVCGAEGESATGHDWMPATSEKPMTCEVCGMTSGSVRSDRFEGVDITILVDGVSELDDTWFCRKIEEVFGCTVDLMVSPMYNEKVQQMLATGNMPTICLVTDSIEKCIELGEQGLLVDVMAPENLAKMPNFKSLFVDNKRNNQMLMATAAKDGSHYILPAYESTWTVDYYWVYDETVFEKAGIEWAGDVNGFLDMLRKLKKYDPESYPLTGARWDATLNSVCHSFNINSSYAAYDWNKNEWYFGATTDNYYTMMRMFQTAYNEGLMSPAMLTQKLGDLQNDLMSQASSVFNIRIAFLDVFNSSFNQGDIDYGHYLPAPAPVGINGMTAEVPKFSSVSGTVISAKDPRAAECAMAIMDWLYDTSENGGAYFNTIGDDFMLTTGENGQLTWIGADAYDTVGFNTSFVQSSYGMCLPTLTVRYCPDSPALLSPPEVEMAQKIGDQAGYFQCPPPLPAMNQRISDLYTKAQKDINQMHQDFILENWSKADFDSWAATFNTTYKSVIDYLNSYF